MFIETNTSDRKNQSTCSSSTVDKQPVEPVESVDQIIAESSTNEINSIVNLNDNEICPISLENLKNLSADHFITDELDDDDQIKRQLNDSKEHVYHIPIDENEEKKLTYFEGTMFDFQRSILDQVRHFFLFLFLF